MTAFLYSAPAGVPGAVTRAQESNIEPAMLIAASAVFAQAFGIPMKYVAGGIQQFNGGAETPASFAGVLIREVPSIGGSAAQGFNDAIPNSESVQGFLVRGYCNVLCAVGTPVRGTKVFVQIVENGGVTVGSFRADDDGANAIEMTDVTWASDGKDADNIAEIRVSK